MPGTPGNPIVVTAVALLMETPDALALTSSISRCRAVRAATPTSTRDAT